MTSDKRTQNLIFNFERPETPTEIGNTFAVSANTASNLRSPVAEDGRESPMYSGHDAANVQMDKGNKDFAVAPSINEAVNSSSVFFFEDEDFTVEEQLSLAQERIIGLERKLDIVVKELRLSQEKAKKLASQGQRLRRLARSGDLFRRNNLSYDNLIGKHLSVL